MHADGRVDFPSLDRLVEFHIENRTDGIVAVGSGGPYAMAAARALANHSPLDARQIAEESMKIAADICIYTNPNLTIEEL